MMTLSDTTLLKHTLELRQIVDLVRTCQALHCDLVCESSQARPVLHLARLAEKDHTPEHFKTLASEVHSRMRTLVAGIHNWHVQRGRLNQIGPFYASATIHMLNYVLPQVIARATPQEPNLWALQLETEEYHWQLGVFDHYERQH